MTKFTVVLKRKFVADVIYVTNPRISIQVFFDIFFGNAGFSESIDIKALAKTGAFEGVFDETPVVKCIERVRGTAQELF